MKGLGLVTILSSGGAARKTSLCHRAVNIHVNGDVNRPVYGAVYERILGMLETLSLFVLSQLSSVPCLDE